MNCGRALQPPLVLQNPGSNAESAPRASGEECKLGFKVLALAFKDLGRGHL